MKIAIVSDSHDNLPNIYKALGYIKKQGIDTIVHCGDVCAPKVLEEFAKNFSGKIYLVYGNVDGDHEGFKRVARENPRLTLFEDSGEINFGNLVFALTHYPEQAEDLARSGSYDVVFYGHTHIPWEKKVGKATLLNPGTLAGLFQKATFAIFDADTKTAQLVLLEKI